MEKKIYDNDLGTILLRTAPRATRYTLKISKGMITATMPVGGDEGRMLSFIEENRQKLLNALKKHPARPLLNEIGNNYFPATYFPDGTCQFLYEIGQQYPAYRLSAGNPV